MKIYVRDIINGESNTNYIEITKNQLRRLCDNAIELQLDNIDADGNFYFLMY